MIWFTSDLHFFHKNVIRLCNRPFADLNDMHDQLVKNILNCCKPRDTLVVVGDITFGNTTNTKAIISTIKDAGVRLVAVRGNHDPGPESLVNMGFDLVVEDMNILIAGRKVHVSHYPFAVGFFKNLWLKLKGIKIRYQQRRPKRGTYLIHGHTHSKKRFEGRAIHVGVDAWGFKPVSIKDIESYIAKKEKGVL